MFCVPLTRKIRDILRSETALINQFSSAKCAGDLDV